MTPARPRRWLALLAAVLLCGCQTLGTLPVAPAAAPGAAAGTGERAGAADPTGPAAVPEPPTPQQAASTATPLERLRRGLAVPTCGDGPRIRYWINRYQAPARRLAAQLEALRPLFEYVLGQVERAGLPTQFALIPLIESDFGPLARGRGGPAGLWQLMPATARSLGLRVDARFDGRLSAHHSGQAALAHLANLQERFGDWRAAAMAYNAGEFRLARALRAAGSNRISAEKQLPPGLAPVTYDYVAKLRALACFIQTAGESDFGLDTMPDPALATLDLPPGEYLLDEIAGAAGLDPAEIRRLNGGHRDDRIRHDSPRTLLLPAATSLTTVDFAALARAPVLEHVVAGGDSLWAIARRHGVSLTELLSWNGLSPSAVLRPGQRIRLAP